MLLVNLFFILATSNNSSLHFSIFSSYNNIFLFNMKSEKITEQREAIEERVHTEINDRNDVWNIASSQELKNPCTLYSAHLFLLLFFLPFSSHSAKIHIKGRLSIFCVYNKGLRLVLLWSSSSTSSLHKLGAYQSFLDIKAFVSSTAE